MTYPVVDILTHFTDEETEGQWSQAAFSMWLSCSERGGAGQAAFCICNSWGDRAELEGDTLESGTDPFTRWLVSAVCVPGHR